MAIDRYDWHYASSVEAYCEEKTLDQEQLSDADYEVIESRSAAHIGFFIAWLIKRDLIGYEDEPSPSIDRVRNEEMTGTQYLMGECDGKFWNVDVAPALHPYIDAFYEEYLSEYGKLISEQFGKTCYTFEFSWDYYRAIEPMIDRLYGKYAQKK